MIEAFCRGRAVVGARAGGVPDLVEEGVSGLLADPEDVDGLAENVVRVLSDRGLAERLAASARSSAHGWVSTPEEFARRLAELVERARRRAA